MDPQNGHDLLEQTFTENGAIIRCKLCCNFEREYPITERSAMLAAQEYGEHVKRYHPKLMDSVGRIAKMEAERAN